MKTKKIEKPVSPVKIEIVNMISSEFSGFYLNYYVDGLPLRNQIPLRKFKEELSALVTAKKPFTVSWLPDTRIGAKP
jgi:hypothetical protein